MFRKIRKYIILIWFLVAVPMGVYTFGFVRYFSTDKPTVSKQPFDWGFWLAYGLKLIPGAHPYGVGWYTKNLSAHKDDIESYFRLINIYKREHRSLSLSFEEARKKFNEENPSTYEDYLDTVDLVEKIETNPRQTFKGAMDKWKRFLKDFYPFEFIATAILTVMFLGFAYNLKKLLVVLWILIVAPMMFMIIWDWGWGNPYGITGLSTVVYFAILYLMPAKSVRQNRREMKESPSRDLKVLKDSEVINKVANGERFIIQQKGNPKAAVISMEDLKKLEEAEKGLKIISCGTRTTDTKDKTSPDEKSLDNKG